MVNDQMFMRFDEGVFKPHFEKFIEYKRGKGEKVGPGTLKTLRVINRELNRFSNLELSKEDLQQLLRDTAGKRSIAYQKDRICKLRQFTLFLRSQGINCATLPARYGPKAGNDFVPYIFSDQELKRIVQEADNLTCRRHISCGQSVYPVLTRILIGTGMRIGEVLKLDNRDVDTEKGVISVFHGKNDISRFVPVSESLKKVLVYYQKTKSSIKPKDPFFVSPYTGSYYSYDAMKWTFPRLFQKAGIFRGNGKTPNIHSFRHTFCTHSLQKMLDSGMNIYTAVPILAAYVGHVNYHDSEKYIHFTEDAYQKFLSDQFFMDDIIPEADHEEG